MTFTILLLVEFCVVFMSKHSSYRMSIETQWHFDADVLAWAPSPLAREKRECFFFCVFVKFCMDGLRCSMPLGS